MVKKHIALLAIAATTLLAIGVAGIAIGWFILNEMIWHEKEAVSGSALLGIIPKKMTQTYQAKNLQCEREWVPSWNAGTHEGYGHDAPWRIDPQYMSSDAQASTAHRDYWIAEGKPNPNCEKAMAGLPIQRTAIPTYLEIDMTDYVDVQSCKKHTASGFCTDVAQMAQRMEESRNYRAVMAGKYRAYYRGPQEVGMEYGELIIPIENRVVIKISGGSGFAQKDYIGFASQIDILGLERLLDCKNGKCNEPPKANPGPSANSRTEMNISIGVPNDTLCTLGWPNRQGNLITLNEQNNACDVFEVTDPGLIRIANTSLVCFDTDCKGDGETVCHADCNRSLKESGVAQKKDALSFKAFAARYFIYALGPQRQYMQGYYYPEIECQKALLNSTNGSECNPDKNFAPVLSQMSCRPPVGHPYGWASNENMSENSCIMSDLPAHASLSILHTGTCVDYSVALATLLRMVGYSKDEVYSLRAPGHRYNIVKFPGAKNWTIADTVDNAPRPMDDNWRWENDGVVYQHCDYTQERCSNDAGTVMCPPKNEVDGCQ